MWINSSANRKVAIIEPVGGHGGMNYYDFALCRGLVQAGTHVTLYTCAETNLPNDLPFDVKPYFRRIYGRSAMLWRGMNYVVSLVRSLWSARFIGTKVSHFHFFHASLLEWLSVSLAKLHGFKVVVTAHDIESFSGAGTQTTLRRIYGSTDRIIVHNQVSRKELIERLHISQSRVRVIPHGNYIDYVGPRITSQQAREKLMLQGEGPFLLFFGQIKKVKGLDVLLNALPNVIRRFPSLRLIIAGKVWKDNFSKYEALIDKLNITSNIVSHIRYVPDDLVSYYYRSADLVLLPYHKIYQSGVLLMAMSFSCPVLVSDLEGMTEVVKDAVNGFVFRTGDATHLAERLIQILANPEKMEEVGSASYETVAKQYNWKRIGRKTANVYYELES